METIKEISAAEMEQIMTRLNGANVGAQHAAPLPTTHTTQTTSHTNNLFGDAMPDKTTTSDKNAVMRARLIGNLGITLNMPINYLRGFDIFEMVVCDKGLPILDDVYLNKDGDIVRTDGKKIDAEYMAFLISDDLLIKILRKLADLKDRLLQQLRPMSFNAYGYYCKDLYERLMLIANGVSV